MVPVLVYITCADDAEARRIAQFLLEERLIACANFAPVSSLYRWQGVVESASETLLLVKTMDTRYPALEKRVKELHSYDTPCLLALPVVAGNPDYIDWIRDSVRPLDVV